MARNNNGNAQVRITVDGKQAISFYKQLEQEEKRLASLAKQGDKEAEKERQKVVTLLTDAKKELTQVDDVLKGKVFANLNKLEQMAKNVKLQMRYTDSIEELRKLQIQYKGLTDRIRELTNQTTQSSHAFGRLFQRAAEYTGFYMLFNRSQQLIKNAIQGNLKLSDSISDIQKVSGLSEESVKGLVTQIEKLDSRNSPEVLNNMAYAAGKLGIKGAENLLGFTRAADKLNVALKEYLGDGADGVVKLMKFANVMGTSDQYGVEQALLKTGSALNYMTQSTAAAADYMIEFASRFGPIARQANMTEGDVIGLASALDALSVNNEEAATSLQKFVVKLLSAPTSVSKALGMDANEAKQLVETGRSIELVEQALGKLGERAQKYGVSGISSVIGDIGSKGQAQRLIKTLATLSNNTEMVHKYVVMANGAFEKGTSVIEEYNIKNENAAAIMERVRNSWEKVMVNSENVGLVKDLAQELYDLSKQLQESDVWMNTLKITVTGLFKVFSMLIKALPSLIIMLASMGFSKLIVGIGNATVALWAFIRAANAGTMSWKLFSTAVKTNIFGFLLSIIPIVLQLIDQFKEKTEEAANAAKEAASMEAKFNAAVIEEKNAMDSVFSRLVSYKKSKKDVSGLIKEINTKYKDYLDNLLTEKSSIDEIRKAQLKANSALRENIALKFKKEEADKMGEEAFKTREESINQILRGAGSGKNTDAAIDFLNQWTEENKSRFAGNEQEMAKAALQEMGKRFGSQFAEAMNYTKAPDNSKVSFYAQSLISGQYRNRGIGDAWQQIGSDYAEKESRDQSLYNIYKGVESFIQNERETMFALKDLDKKYDRLIGGTGTGTVIPEDTEDSTTVLEDFSKENAAAERERLKLEREQLQMLEKEVGGMGALIESFYNKRAAAIDEMYQNKEITGMQRDRMQAENKVDKAYAQNAAWRMMLGEDGSPELWTEQLNVMKNQVVTSSEQYGKEMQQVWTDIGTKNLADIGERLQRFGTKMTGGMKKTISVNQKEIEKSGAQLLQQVQTDMERYDYAEQVKTKFLGILQQMYLFRTKFEDGIEENFKDVQEASRAGMDELIAMYDQLFNLDLNPDGSLTEKGLEQFREMLSKTEHLSADMAKSTKEELQTLFYQTVKLGEATTEALKKQVDRQKKIIDERWKHDPQNLANQRREEDSKNTSQLASTITGKWGIQSTVETKDAEIELYALKLQAATDYYNKLKAEKAEQRLLDEQQAKMMEAQIALQTKLGERISALQQLFVDSMNTLPELGTALGEAFSKTDPEDRAQAFQDALKNMVQSLGEATKKMILEWVKQRIQESIQQKLMVAETTQAEAQKASAVIGAEQAIATAKQAIGQQSLATQATQSAESLSTSAAETTGEVNLGIASGAAKTIAKLGWWGIPLVAVITALLNGLLSWALGSLFKGKETSSTAKNNETNSTLRLVKGMLTYDEGNVQTFQQAKEGGAYTVLGTDGRVYSAHKQSELPTGIVRRPTATLINGQPSLVAEKGPELIVGRKTLAAMTQFRPDLVNEIVKFDYNRRRGFRLYDEGNIMDSIGTMTSNGLTQGNLPSDGNTPLLEALQQSQATNEQVIAVLSALTTELHKGIGVRKYGTGGLVEEVIDGLYTTKKRNTSPMLRRLLGS